jgi:hypothetical protein
MNVLGLGRTYFDDQLPCPHSSLVSANQGIDCEVDETQTLQ